MPLGGPRPQGTQRALRIGQRRLAAFRVTVRRHPVGHHKQGIAPGVKYRGEIAALFIQYHSLVRAARRHQQRDTVGLLRRVNGNCRSANAGDRAIGQRGSLLRSTSDSLAGLFFVPGASPPGQTEKVGREENAA